MHKAVLTVFAAAILSAGLIASPALAQSGATQTPPAPNASNSAPEPSNSVPAGAASLSPGAPPTGVVGSTGVGSPSGAGQSAPAAPSGSSGGQPSGAFDKTVPQPASR